MRLPFIDRVYEANRPCAIVSAATMPYVRRIPTKSRGPVTGLSSPNEAVARPAWGGVLAMTLCVMVLIASEFMPVSLLSPIARELGLTEGQTGQAISISGLFAVIFSLTWHRVLRLMDRRRVMTLMAGLLALSGTLVACAPDFLTLMVGRAVLGVAIGGYWSLATAVTLRILPGPQVAAGMAMTSAGVALASTISAPFGGTLGEVIGWRWTFFSVVPLALIAMVWQAKALPSLPALGRKRDSLGLMCDKGVLWGQAALLTFFAGQFMLFTYLRPFLEQITQVSVPVLSALLLIFGLAGVLGNVLVRMAPRIGPDRLLVGVPLAMALIAGALVVWGADLAVVAVLLALWGFAAAPAPALWGMRLTRARPNDAEALGGMFVAKIQLAIMLGAVLGGLVMDRAGPLATAGVSAAFLAVATAIAARGCSVLAHSSSLQHRSSP